MNKLVVTKEQEKLVQLLGRGYINHKSLLDKFVSKERDFEVLNDFTPEQFALLLCGWYTVEKSFKQNDYVVYKHTGNIFKVRFVRDDGFIETDDHFNECYTDPNHFRHATSEEITHEQRRRFWDNLGREIGEYKKGDITFDYLNNRYSEVENDILSWDHFPLVCPVEKRVDL